MTENFLDYVEKASYHDREFSGLHTEGFLSWQRIFCITYRRLSIMTENFLDYHQNDIKPVVRQHRQPKNTPPTAAWAPANWYAEAGKADLHLQLQLHLSRSLSDRWGTTVDFTTNILHSQFSIVCCSIQGQSTLWCCLPIVSSVYLFDSLHVLFPVG